MLPPAGPGIRPPAPGRRKSVTRAAWPEVHDAVANALPGGYSPGLQDPSLLDRAGTRSLGDGVAGDHPEWPACPQGRDVGFVPARGIRNDLVLHLADPGQEPARHSQKAAGCPAAEVGEHEAPRPARPGADRVQAAGGGHFAAFAAGGSMSARSFGRPIGAAMTSRLSGNRCLKRRGANDVRGPVWRNCRRLSCRNASTVPGA